MSVKSNNVVKLKKMFSMYLIFSKRYIIKFSKIFFKHLRSGPEISAIYFHILETIRTLFYFLDAIGNVFSIETIFIFDLIVIVCTRYTVEISLRAF